MLSVTNLTKYFGKTKVLDSISFSIPKGKKIGVLGPNGAGKTTTIRIITGILPKTSGEIKLYDKIIDPESINWKSKFGVVPEISNAYLDYSPLQNLQFSGGLYGLSRKNTKEKAKQLLSEFGLIEKINSKTKKLSKGQKQRLNLCMALIHDPEIYFLDEPTTGLDIKSAQFVRNKIIKLCKNGKTIFLTTHNLIEANNLCDEVLILNRGKIVASGPPDELRKKFLPASKIRLNLDQIPDNTSMFKDLDIDFQLDATNRKIIFYSTNPIEDFSRIQNFLVNQELKITNLEIISATLEEVFLKILGEV